jgi:hypothetical protein
MSEYKEEQITLARLRLENARENCDSDYNDFFVATEEDSARSVAGANEFLSVVTTFLEEKIDTST